MAIVRVALPVAAHQLFDYWLPEGLSAMPGNIVVVTLGRRRLRGVVLEVVAASDVPPERVIPIDQLSSDLPPLADDLRELARFTAAYYQEPIGECYALMLPPASEGARRASLVGPMRYRLSDEGRKLLHGEARAGGHRRAEMLALLTRAEGAAEAQIREWGSHALRTLREWHRNGLVEALQGSAAGIELPGVLTLNDEQRDAIQAALPQSSDFLVSLLQGVTGSGKSEVYLASAARVIAAGRQALLLVPEINLTPQLEERVAAALPGVRVALLHSRLAAAARRSNWLAAARGDAQLVLGTRLAVFAQLPQLGLIVVDEEHDASYKQQDGVHYNARDLAVYRARLRNVPVILGSATPSLESYAQAQRGRYAWLKLTQRATAHVALPAVRLVPSRGADDSDGISAPLDRAIAERLDRREQALLFVNRRGYAPSLLCVACGWKAICPNCDARLVVHRDADQLRCHHCGEAVPLPRACPSCGNKDLLPLGFGTQRLEQGLASRFPSARILRIDRDSTRRKGSFAAMRDTIGGGEVDILVGTQMLAKGHDFPHLTLVGVLGADNALYSADFRATERLFALLEQVAGRAGRGASAGEVIVQTDFPEHAVYAALADHDYDRFASGLLSERKALELPPFAHLALLAGEAKNRDVLMEFLTITAELGRALSSSQHLGCEIYPPVAAGLARRAGLERAQVLVQCADRSVLQGFLPRWREAIEHIGERRVRWSIDVDPLGFA